MTTSEGRGFRPPPPPPSSPSPTRSDGPDPSPPARRPAAMEREASAAADCSGARNSRADAELAWGFERGAIEVVNLHPQGTELGGKSVEFRQFIRPR